MKFLNLLLIFSFILIIFNSYNTSAVVLPTLSGIEGYFTTNSLGGFDINYIQEIEDYLWFQDYGGSDVVTGGSWNCGATYWNFRLYYKNINDSSSDWIQSNTYNRAFNTYHDYYINSSNFEIGEVYEYVGYWYGGNDYNRCQALVYGGNFTYEGLSNQLPSANTINVTEINTTHYQINGYVDLGTYDFATYRFNYEELNQDNWKSSTYQDLYTSNNVSYIIEVESGKSYRYEIKVIYYSSDCDETLQDCESGESYSNPTTFSTSGYFEAPEIETNLVTDITESSANLQGNIISVGGYENLNAYFEYGLINENTTKTANQSLSSVGVFNHSISGLSASQTYKYRACVYYSDTYTCGSWNIFKTITSSYPEYIQQWYTIEEGYYDDTYIYDIQNNKSALLNNVYIESKLNNNALYNNESSYIDIYHNFNSTKGISFGYNFFAENTAPYLATISDNMRPEATEDGMAEFSLYLRLGQIGTNTLFPYGSITLSYNPRNRENNVLFNVNSSHRKIYFNSELIYTQALDNSDSLENIRFRLFKKIASGTNGNYIYMDDIVIFNEELKGDVLSDYLNNPYYENFSTLGGYTPELNINPEIELKPYENLNHNSIDLFTNISDLGTYDEVTLYFEYWLDNETFNESIKTDNQSITESGIYNDSLEWLDVNQGYFYRACIDYELEGETFTQCSGINNFKTLEAPEIVNYNPDEIAYNYALLKGEIENIGDYDSIDVYFEYYSNPLNISISESQTITTPNIYFTYILNLTPYITYTYRTCGDYGDNLSVCSVYKSFTTIDDTSEPEFSLNDVIEITDTRAKFKATLSSFPDYLDSALFYYKLKKINETYNLIDTKSITYYPQSYDYIINTLESNTQYYVQLCFGSGAVEYCDEELMFVTLEETSDIIIPTPDTSESEIDEIWDTLLQGSDFAKLIMGFFLVFAITFLGLSVSGKYNLNLGAFGLVVFIFLGIILATILKLFSWAIFGTIVIGSLVIIILKLMIGHNSN